MWPLIRDAVEGQWKATADSFSQGAQFEGISGTTITQQCTARDSLGECIAWGP